MKRLFCTVLSGVMLVTALTACGLNKEGQEGEAKTVTLTWMKNTGTDAETAWEDLMAAQFEEANEGVKVEIERMAYDNYVTSLQTKLASGAAPDLFYVDASNMSIYVKNDYLLDLSDAPFLENFEQSDLANESVNGKVFAIGSGATSMNVTYNKDVFAEAGVTSIPTTLDEFYAVLEQLKAAGFVPIANAFKEPWTISANLQTDYITGVLSKDANAIINTVSREQRFADSELWREQFTRFLERYQYSNKDPFGTDWNAACDMLANGQAGMVLNGNWAVSNTQSKNPDVNLGSFALPISNNAEESVMLIQGPQGGSSIYNSSPNKELALEFLGQLMSPESASLSAEMTQGMTVVKGATVSADSSPALQDILTYIEQDKVFRQGGIDHNFPNEYRTALENTVSKHLLLDNPSVEALLDDLDSEFDRIAKSAK